MPFPSMVRLEQWRSRAGQAALWTLFALVPAGGAAGGLALAPLVGIAGGLAGRWRAWPLGPGLWALLAWFAASALASAWSPSASAGLQALKAGGVLLPGAALAAAAWSRAPMRDLVRPGVLAALIVLMALLAVEAVLDMPLNRAAQPDAPTWMLHRNPGRGVTIMIGLIWAGLALLLARGGRFRQLGAVGAFAGGAALCGQFGQDANAAAFAAGAAGFALGWAAPRLAPAAAACGLALWLLAAPWASAALARHGALGEALPWTWGVRLEIWRFACARIAEAPWFGWGMDAGRAMDHPIRYRGVSVDAMPLHPHSASLQVWLETGLLGAGLAAAALALLGWSLRKAGGNDRPFAAAACASVCALGLIANVSFGLWQEWWLACLCLSAAAVTAVRRV